MGDKHTTSLDSKMEQEINKNHFSKDVLGCDLWTDGLICAYEFVQASRKASHYKSSLKIHSTSRREGWVSKQPLTGYGVKDASRKNMNKSSLTSQTGLNNTSSICVTDELNDLNDNEGGHDHSVDSLQTTKEFPESHWVPIGWDRISELVQTIQVDAGWDMQPIEFADVGEDLTVQDVAAPYWERPAGPTWWCHVSPGHQSIDAWLSTAQWLHPAISVALRNESRLISDRMRHLFYEVPVRVAGGLLFELLGQSPGDPFSDEDDTPIVLRSWQAQKFLITALHVKGTPSNINVLGITEVQELLSVGGSRAPKSIHEVIAHLVTRLSRWDDRLFRKYIFGASDEVELKFVNRRNREDLSLLSIILNQEIKRLSTQVIRVKWSLHAREEIVFELLQHLRGSAAKNLLEGIRKSTREMIEEQEAVRGRLFTIQDVMQSTVRAWLQDRSLCVQHNLAVFGGCGLVVSVVAGLFGINVDGIPGAQNTPYAFGLFAASLFFLGAVLIGLGMLYLGLKRPVREEKVEVRRLELQQLVNTFRHDAETHAKVRQARPRQYLPRASSDMTPEAVDYVVIQ